MPSSPRARSAAHVPPPNPVTPGAERRADFTALRRALRRGQLVADRAFDEVFPWTLRRASSIHWTPVEAAMRAAELLAPTPGATILDVGAGPGKFCIVAAASQPLARVRGVEHRRHFVDVASEAARATGVDVAFVHGTLDDEDPAAIDGLYLFNPFAENLSPRADHLDETVELSEARFEKDIATTVRFVRAMRPGARIVTYCGFGGAMPDELDLVLKERRAGALELWVRSTRAEKSALSASGNRTPTTRRRGAVRSSGR